MRKIFYAIMIGGFMVLAIRNFVHGNLLVGLDKTLIAILWLSLEAKE